LLQNFAPRKSAMNDLGYFPQKGPRDSSTPNRLSLPKII
jgi:hypothetical protein